MGKSYSPSTRLSMPDFTVVASTKAGVIRSVPPKSVDAIAAVE